MRMAGLLVLASGLWAQKGVGFGSASPTVTTPPPVEITQNFVMAGASRLTAGGWAATGIYAHATGTSTYAFTVMDVVPITGKSPASFTQNIGVGVAQKAFTLTFGSVQVPVFIPVATGFSWTGANSGWSWSGGALATIPIGKGFQIPVAVRFVKSSVNANSGLNGYQFIFTLGPGFGW